MELKKYFIVIILLNLTNVIYADTIQPTKNLSAYEVVKIQLNALMKNNESKHNDGIKQTWIFAHPENKKFTGPYERFEKMILSNQYKILLNHVSHKINLITDSKNKNIYSIELIAKNKIIYFYEWHIEIGSTEKCKNCWFTTLVSPPINKGNTI
jgi:hypothetical protein